MKRTVLAITLLVTVACASTRHVLVQVDATFAQAVFAVDDAEFQACAARVAPFTAEVCAAANPKIKQALVDVKAVTAALQATPKSGVVPKDLPSLIQNLNDVQGILLPLSQSVAKSDVTTKVQSALAKATAVLTAVAGVK